MRISVGPLQHHEQAVGVAQLFRQVYGEGYPVELYYQPEQLLEVNREGSTLSQIACDQSGRVVGHCALYPSAPNPRLLEVGAGLVHPDTRGKGTISDLVASLVARAKSERLADWLFAEAVCNHTTTQRTVHREGFVDTALEIDLMPAAAYSREASAVGRVSTLLSFLPLTDPGGTVFLPSPYLAELQELYGALGVSRQYGTAQTTPISANLPGQLLRWRNEAADLLRLTVVTLGSDFEASLQSEATITQVSLPLDVPEVGWAVERARASGFVSAGLLPCWGGMDHLLMQRFSGPTEWEQVSLESEPAKAMLERIRRESGVSL